MTQAITAASGVSLMQKDGLFRLVRDLIANELIRTRGEDWHSLSVANWTDKTNLRESGLNLDSMERMATAESVAEYFNLYESGGEDYLLLYETLGEWVNLIATCLAQSGDSFFFRTSGSSGSPKMCKHFTSNLIAEAELLASFFENANKIISFVPSHHIYGFLYSVMLPHILQQKGGRTVELVEARFLAPGKLMASIEPNDLLIATPTHYKLYASAIGRWRKPLMAASSTEPMQKSLWHQLEAQDITLREIYGSSETAGIGSRISPECAFELFPYWSRDGDHSLKRRSDDQSYELQDTLDWTDDSTFLVSGRRDTAVQVAGHNVFPGYVSRVLMDMAEVQDVHIRFDTAEGRLKALIIPDDENADTDKLKDVVRDYAARKLLSHERPARISVRNEVPRNSLGKVQDWD